MSCNSLYENLVEIILPQLLLYIFISSIFKYNPMFLNKSSKGRKIKFSQIQLQRNPIERNNCYSENFRIFRKYPDKENVIQFIMNF